MLTAVGLRALFKAIGVDLPSSGSVVATRTIVVSLLVGVLVTMLSTLVPALRATRVVPVEALREGAVMHPHGPSRKVTALAVVLTAIGVGLMCVGLFVADGESAALSAMGGGAAATFLGVALLSPYLVRPLASLVGRPLERMTGITGRLARRNTTRLPGRTAATAAALMIGVALVTFASIFAAGARETINRAVDQNLTAAAGRAERRRLLGLPARRPCAVSRNGRRSRRPARSASPRPRSTASTGTRRSPASTPGSSPSSTSSTSRRAATPPSPRSRAGARR